MIDLNYVLAMQNALKFVLAENTSEYSTVIHERLKFNNKGILKGSLLDLH